MMRSWALGPEAGAPVGSVTLPLALVSDRSCGPLSEGNTVKLLVVAIQNRKHCSPERPRVASAAVTATRGTLRPPGRWRLQALPPASCRGGMDMSGAGRTWPGTRMAWGNVTIHSPHRKPCLSDGGERAAAGPEASLPSGSPSELRLASSGGAPTDRPQKVSVTYLTAHRSPTATRARTVPV